MLPSLAQFSMSKSLLTDAGEGYSEAKRSRPDAEVETNVSLPVQPQLKAKAVGVRNPLEASLSSSRRHQDRQVRKCQNLYTCFVVDFKLSVVVAEARSFVQHESREQRFAQVHKLRPQRVRQRGDVTRHECQQHAPPQHRARRRR